MHYIVGTCFSVTPASKVVRGARDRVLVPGITYTLLHITRSQESVLYKFRGNDGKIIEIDFPNCNEADLFISKYRNEKLPVYNYDTSEFFRLD